MIQPRARPASTPRAPPALPRRLALAAHDTAAGLRRVWEETPARGEGEGEDPRASDMGRIAAEACSEHARRALEHDVFERLASHGIEAEPAPQGGP